MLINHASVPQVLCTSCVNYGTFFSVTVLQSWRECWFECLLIHCADSAQRRLIKRMVWIFAPTIKLELQNLPCDVANRETAFNQRTWYKDSVLEKSALMTYPWARLNPSQLKDWCSVALPFLLCMWLSIKSYLLWFLSLFVCCCIVPLFSQMCKYSLLDFSFSS